MRNKKPFTIWKKTLGAILLLLGLTAVSLGVTGTSFMVRNGIYVLDAQAYMQEYLEENMEIWGKEILYTYYMEGREAADLIVEGCNIEYIVLNKEYAEQARPYIEDAEWYRVYTFDKVSGSRFNFNRIDKYAIIMMVPRIKMYPDYIACISFDVCGRTAIGNQQYSVFVLWCRLEHQGAKTNRWCIGLCTNGHFVGIFGGGSDMGWKEIRVFGNVIIGCIYGGRTE